MIVVIVILLIMIILIVNMILLILVITIIIVSTNFTPLPSALQLCSTPNLPTNINGFRGFDSSIILISRGGILMPKGNFPESSSQAMLVGTMLLGRLGVRLSGPPGTLVMINVVFFQATQLHLCTSYI